MLNFIRAVFIAGLLALSVGPVSLAGAQTHQPISLSAEELDLVTAGAAAFAEANAVALGEASVAATDTDTFADPNKAKAIAKGVAIGPDAAAADSQATLVGEHLSGHAGGTVVNANGGKAKVVTRGRVRIGRKREVLVTTVRLISRGPLSVAEAFAHINAPEGALITTTYRKIRKGRRTIHIQKIKAIFYKG